MSSETSVLMVTAATIGFFHTLIGPDHYVPFIVLSKTRGWSSIKTAVITLLCGLGHVLSSIILGFVGIAVGIAIFKLEAIEAFRGDIAGWLLIAFGFTYLIWGIRKAIRNKPHEHPHHHENGAIHSHTHAHIGVHTHVHGAQSANITPWILFIIFVFGPCEPLIPLVMYPAAKGSIISVVIVASIFGLTTIATMLGIVLVSFYGLSKLPIRRLERYSHALAGLAILLCGSAIKFLGL
ncbi:MAG: sulfite exporter TauE/SafE family protein [candidate division WOR-3 bacterium]|nr:MAG: sulfite exporter TauE/SafE family protein [candidate division WOR-3 bacterium]